MRQALVLSIVVGIVAGCGSLGSAASQGPGAASGAAASTSLLARGTFKAKGADVVLDATGGDSSVSGTMAVAHDGEDFTVDLTCARIASDGRIVIGGDTTASTSGLAKKGTRTAIVLKPGSPVHAVFQFESGAPMPSCLDFLDSFIDFSFAKDIGPDGLEPIEGTVTLGP